MKDTVWSELAPLHVSVDFQELEDAFAARQPVKARAQASIAPSEGIFVTVAGVQLLLKSLYLNYNVLR